VVAHVGTPKEAGRRGRGIRLLSPFRGLPATGCGLDAARGPGRGYPWPVDDRTILHVDMDAFYASVEQRDDPSLRGRPVIVGGTGGRGGWRPRATRWRRYGVHSGHARGARRCGRCPDAVLRRGPASATTRTCPGRCLRSSGEFTPLVQGLSLDEAFLDVTAGTRALGDGEHVARQIQAPSPRAYRAQPPPWAWPPNKLVAKIASDLRKPDGLVVVRAGGDQRRARPAAIRKLFGLGAKTAPKVEGARHPHARRIAPGPGRRGCARSSAVTPERVLQRAAGI